MAKSKSNVQGLRTREKVIETALKALATRGTHDVSIQDVADESGLDRALVAYHFKDKAGIFREVWSHVYKQALLETESRISSSGSSIEKLASYFQVSIAFFTENHDITVLYLQLHYLSAFDEKSRHINTQIKQRAIHRVAKIIMDGQRAGELKLELDPYLTAKMIHSSLVGIIINSITEFQDFSLKDILVEFTSRILNSLKP